MDASGSSSSDRPESESPLRAAGIPDKPQAGEILAVGPGRMMDDGHCQPIAVAIGDTVLFGKYAGTELRLDHEDLLVMRESDILGTLESERFPIQ